MVISLGTIDLFRSSSSAVRLAHAADALARLGAGDRALLVAASRAAADECAFAAAARRGGLFGVTRTGFHELALRLASARLARDGHNPLGGLATEALITRAVFSAARDGHLSHLQPVVGTPGFPRAVARTLQELDDADLTADTVVGAGAAGADLAALMRRADEDAAAAGSVSRTAVYEVAAEQAAAGGEALDGVLIVLLDVALTAVAHEELVRALAARATSVVAVCAEADVRSRAGFARLGARPAEVAAPPEARALDRVQRFLFSTEAPPVRPADESLVIFSAPGEGREATEIARRVLDEAARGVRFDEMAVLLRAPGSYLGVIEHAFSRAGIPVWFERGTRRPDPAGRALLALLACADEHLSARRFAEYLSMGQVPVASSPERAWTPPTDDLAEHLVPAAERAEDPPPLDEAPAPGERDGERVVAGTLQTPWRWEELLVEAYVIEGLPRWRTRLPGLRHEFERRIRELVEDEPDSPRIAAFRRNCDQLRHLEDFALPTIETLDGWRDRQPWSVWLQRLSALAPRVLRQPARVARVLAELAPLGEVGPVALGEVRDVLTPRLRTLTHEPPRRREGRVFVGTCHAARGRAFRVVFVPGLAERVFPQRIREDALLLDVDRQRISAALPVRHARAEDERLQLGLAVGAARDRLYASYPRIDARESRARVPSFYVLDIVRAATGHVPSYSEVAAQAERAGASSLAWPAPPSPEQAIDDFEHDLSVLRPLLLSRDPAAVQGRARYLVDLNPALRRSVTERWMRHQRRWSRADGLVMPSPDARALLAANRLTARAYSLTALQRYASCPYQFLLAAIYRLSPLEEPAPLQRLDPLTRGSLFHEMQTRFYRTLQQNGQLPVTAARLAAARQQLEWAIAEVARQAAEKLAPAIERVWTDEIASIRRDLLLWVDKLADEPDWVPERFEFAFGLPPDDTRDPASVTAPALVDGRFLLRGSIDLVERHPQTRALRVTDHKTGKNRVRPHTVVHGGQVLQPVLYGLALEAVTGDTVYEGRLWYCTTVGQYDEHPIQLGDSARRTGLEVLEILDRAVEHGPLGAMPAPDACRWCDFRPVCGHGEEQRTARKQSREPFADLEALRRLP